MMLFLPCYVAPLTQMSPTQFWANNALSVLGRFDHTGITKTLTVRLFGKPTAVNAVDLSVELNANGLPDQVVHCHWFAVH